MVKKTFEGQFDARGQRLAIVASRFNDFFTTELMEGALDCLRRHGVQDEQIDSCWVPGAFEVPLAAKRFAASGRYAAVICLSCIIQGDTPHFHLVSSEITKGIAQVSLDADVPVIYGVVTAETLDQAIERSGTKAGNKGFDAALTALEMIDLFARIDAG
ncbi:MAG: 6,7-dimethyl-8-ribityllumazine synthase [Candidatus Krumholzibacteriia bacterium]